MSEREEGKEKEDSVDATKRVNSNRDRLTKTQLLAELERTEQELHELKGMVTQLFKNIPLPMHLIYVDKEHRIRYVSEELAKYRGFGSAEELIGRETTDLFPGSGGKAINAVIDSGKPIDHAEMALGKKTEAEEVKMPILASYRPIHNAQGEIIGAVPAFTEITEQKEKEGALKEQQEYLERNTKNIQAAMMEIANGNLEIELEKEKSDAIGEIIDNVHAVADSVKGVLEEAKLLTDAAAEGKLDIRGDVEKFKGAFAEIIHGLNNTLDAIVEPVREIEASLGRMAVNDYTTFITENYKGKFENLKKNINRTFKGLVHLQNAFKKVADGDLSDLETYRKAGKFSENDELTPAFVSMVGAINDIANEIEMLIEATVDGDLEKRADASKFKGEYAQIVQGLNDTVEAVVKPVKEVMRVCNALAEGDLSERIELEAKGDFLKLTESLNTAAENLAELLGEIQAAMQNVASISVESASSVEQVNSGMQQITSASQEIARGAQETSTTVNESAREIKETSGVLQQVQSNAEESNRFATESAENAKEMTALGKKSADGMKEIQEAIAGAEEVIKNLGSSLEQVGKTTGMIEGIADQTNLLALNAAIEAARAGEHGRGFAVVAEEVRKLSENSKKSTAEIDVMIKSLQEEMEKVMKASSVVTQRADAGLEDLEKVVASVEKTTRSIDSITDMMAQITEGASKGAENMEKVARDVDEVASSAEESATSSEEASSAVEQQTAAVAQLSGGIQKLSEISDQASQMIAKFKLREHDN